MGLKKFLPGRRGRQAQHSRDWFNAGRTIYQKTYFRTLVKHAGNRLANFLRERLHKCGVKPEEATAVEFGPGLTPLAPLLGFKQMVFVDSSRRMIGFWQRMAAAQRMKNLVVLEEDIRHFEERVPVGSVAIINEVLTHVHPSERLGVLERLAKRFDHLYLVDRGVEFEEKHRWEKKWGILPVRRTERKTYRAQDNDVLVSPTEVAGFLRGLGFHVEVKAMAMRGRKAKGPETLYFQLWAERAGKDEVPRLRMRPPGEVVRK